MLTLARLLAATLALECACALHAADLDGRFLYVATPGVRNYMEFGGHGILVFAIDDGHRFVKRIPCQGLTSNGTPSNVKGIIANPRTGLLHISTLATLQCLDLRTEKILWEKSYPNGCDRMSVSPDGETIYLPTLEKDDWHVVAARTGAVIATLSPRSGAHNTVFGSDGKWCYLAGLRSPLLSVADAGNHRLARTIGPFSAPIRPFTINHSQSLAFCCVNDLLGFEVGDLASGRMIHRVEIPGEKTPVKRHGCPSHGIGLTPDEKEIWVCAARQQKVWVFDATMMPPRAITSVALRDEPGWVTFSIDGAYAYPSPGEVIDVKSKKIIARLTDEQGRAVASEKVLEVDFAAGRVVATGNQFGVGRK